MFLSYGLAWFGLVLFAFVDTLRLGSAVFIGRTLGSRNHKRRTPLSLSADDAQLSAPVHWGGCALGGGAARWPRAICFLA